MCVFRYASIFFQPACHWWPGSCSSQSQVKVKPPKIEFQYHLNLALIFQRKVWLFQLFMFPNWLKIPLEKVPMMVMVIVRGYRRLMLMSRRTRTSPGWTDGGLKPTDRVSVSLHQRQHRTRYLAFNLQVICTPPGILNLSRYLAFNLRVYLKLARILKPCRNHSFYQESTATAWTTMITTNIQ